MLDAELGSPTPKIRFIRDVAAETDFFGSHERVAKAIASVIAENEDLKVIGLLGRWGSGKSTVVRHVQKFLSSDAAIKTHVFYYDAWLHQSDPPRRSFLEELLSFLVEERLTTQDLWQVQLDVLNRQIEDSETTSTPLLTAVGIVFLFSLALVPLGLNFIGHDWYLAADQAGATWFAESAFWLGWFCIFVPVLIAAGVAAFGKADNKSLLTLFISRQVQKHVNRTIRSPDPTTIEFQKFFRQLVSFVWAENRRLILVVDNLDRLQEREAVAMWNTIRSFFLGSEHANRLSRTARLPTVLLPIDQEAVERMYRVDHGEVLGKRLARSFMEKTFDLTFFVTPPVLSDWNKYLGAQLRHVFGAALDEEWAYQAGRLYERWSQSGEVTPRAINVTINEIASLWLQWHDRGVSFVTVAYFAIFRDEIGDRIAEEVANPRVDISDLDPDWRRGLAALFFGAPPDVAIQVLIEPQLREAIERGDAVQFAQQASLPGFKEVFQRVLDGANLWTSASVANAVTLFSGLKPDASSWSNTVRASLRRMYLHSRPWEKTREGDVNALKALLETSTLPQLAVLIPAVGARLSANSAPLSSDPANLRPFVQMVEALAETSAANELPEVRVNFSGASETYLSVLEHTAERPSAAKAITSEADTAALVGALVNQLEDTQLSKTVEKKFRALLHQARSVNWDPFIQACRGVIENQGATYGGMSAAITCLGRFWNSSELARQVTRELASGGQLTVRLSEFQGAQNYEQMVRVSALILLGQGGLGTPNGVAWTSTIASYPTFPHLLKDVLESFSSDRANTYFLVKAVESDHDVTPLCRAVAHEKLKANSLGRLHIGDIVDNIEPYRQLFDADIDEFISHLPGYDTFWEKVDESDFTESLKFVLLSLARAAPAKLSASHRLRARKTLKQRLQSVSVVEWKTAIRDGGEPLDVALLFAQTQGRPINIGQALFDALQSLSVELASNEQRPFGKRWFHAAKLLSTASMRTLFKNLRDQVASATAIPAMPQLLRLGGEPLLTLGEFAAEGDDCIRHIIHPLLNEADGLKWMAENVDPLAEWVAASSDDTREFLRDQMRHRLSSAEGEAKRQLENLVAGLGIKNKMA